MFNLISENQSGFSPGDFLHKLITHDIYMGLEVRGAFEDIKIVWK